MADGIVLGKTASGGDYVALDTMGGTEVPVSLAATASITVYALAGNDAVSVDGAITAAVTVYGGDGDDLLVGGGGGDTIRGGLGADSIHGGSGGDILYGHTNNSTQIGGDGADSIFAGPGTDQVYVEYGSDLYEAETSEVSGQNAPTPNSSEFENVVKFENTGFGPAWDLAQVDHLIFGADINEPNMIRWVQPDGRFVEFSAFDVKSPTDESTRSSATKPPAIPTTCTATSSAPSFIIRRTTPMRASSSRASTASASAASTSTAITTAISTAWS